MNVDLEYLSEAERNEVRALDDLFASEGWTLLHRKFKRQLEQILGLYRQAATEGALGYVRGRDNLLQEIVEAERIAEIEYQAIAQSRDPEASAEPPEGEDE